MPEPAAPSINRKVLPLLDKLLEQSRELGLAARRLDNGSQVIDAGIAASGSLEAGRLIAEICLGGLAQVRLEKNRDYPHCDWIVQVETESPVLACLASQYAGWSLSHGEGKQAFRALGSGPARALGSTEPLFAELNYRDEADTACLVIETDRVPPRPLVEQIAQRCGVATECLYLILTPTTSVCGVVQVVSRVVETALHKIHTLGLPLQDIVSASGHAPVCPVASDFMTGMGCTNDAILFAGEVRLRLDAPDAELSAMVEKLPSSASPDYGKPFAEVFRAANYDFYKIDPLLFAPALLRLEAVGNGKAFQAGRVDRALLEQSFAAATQAA